MSIKRSKKTLIVPIFIPYQGCPYRCIYCQQEKITSQSNQRIDRTFIEKTLNTAIGSVRFTSAEKREIAFYGGTFTNLPIKRIKELVGVVQPFVEKGYFQSIRISTRPDAVNKERLGLLKRSHVTTVELGAQSMDNDVLECSRRGHTVEDTVNSFGLLKEYGFQVGIQLMPGLPGDSEERFLRSIEKVIHLHPDMVRLYPTLVIKGTELAEWYNRGQYQPMTLRDAIKICQISCVRLEKNGIPVIRIGLMSSPSLIQDGQILAGPWHNAFGFLVRSGIHQKKIARRISECKETTSIGLRVPPREIPLVRGYKNRGLHYLEEETGVPIEYIRPDDTVPVGEVEIDRVNTPC